MRERLANRRRALVVALIPVLVLGAAFEWWIHDAFGIEVPWDMPEHFHVCGREYERGGAFEDPDTFYTLFVHPTFFDLPIPMPDAAPDADHMDSWGGCPMQVVLKRKDRNVVYAFIQGGP
jgi:hypothetical protein